MASDPLTPESIDIFAFVRRLERAEAELLALRPLYLAAVKFYDSTVYGPADSKAFPSLMKAIEAAREGRALSGQAVEPRTPSPYRCAWCSELAVEDVNGIGFCLKHARERLSGDAAKADRQEAME